MKALILILTVGIASSFAGEIVKTRGNKLVFRKDSKESVPQVGDVFLIERDGIEIGRVKYLKGKAHLGAGRIISGVAKKGDMVVKKETEDVAFIQEQDEDLAALKGEEGFIEDEASFEVAAPVRESYETSANVERKSVSENNIAIALIGGANNVSDLTVSLSDVKFLDFKDTKNNLVGASLAYKFSQNFQFNAEFVSGSGTSTACYSQEFIDYSIAEGNPLANTDCIQMNSKVSNINFGVDYFLTKNVYLGFNAGVFKMSLKAAQVSDADVIDLSGGTVGAKLGLHFDLTNSIFMRLEGRYQTTNFNTAKITGTDTNGAKGEVDLSTSKSTQSLSGLAALGVAF